jgi:hypothetical protein
MFLLVACGNDLVPLLLLLLLQVSPDSGLLQCSTVADVMDFTFAGSEVSNMVKEVCSSA